MSSGEESVDIPDEIDLIEEVEGEVDNPIETIEEHTGEEATENTTNKDSDDDDESSKKVVKPKRVVRNPQPKLNEQTLRTSKGLPALTNHFKRVKFKGRGHEAEDLNVLMKTYEYWCHRLFPKFPFDACIARLETLGTKRGTQVTMKKVRLGMEIGDDDRKIISDEEQEGETPITEGFEDTFDNRFDQLLTRIKPSGEPDTTEEQLERIQQNRLRAEALRKQRIEKTKLLSQNEASVDTNVPVCDISSDDVLNSVNDDTEPEKLSSSQKSHTTRRKQIFSSDEEEICKDTEKRNNKGTENDGNIPKKKILTIESDDDETDTKIEESQINTTKICSEGDIRTDEMEADDEEIDLDNILNIVNEESETTTTGSHNEINQRLEQNQPTTDEMEEVNFDNILSIVNEDSEIPASNSPDRNRSKPLNNINVEETDKPSSIVEVNNYISKDNQRTESDEEMDIDEFQQKQPSAEDNEIVK